MKKTILGMLAGLALFAFTVPAYAGEEAGEKPAAEKKEKKAKKMKKAKKDDAEAPAADKK